MGDDLMEAYWGTLVLCLAIFFGSNYLESNEQKNAQIHQLETQLQRQSSARMAEIVFAEKQAAMYQGCNRFINLCSEEMRESGERRLREGYAGTTSGWYWVGYLGVPVCMASALGAFLAVLFTASSYLQLKAVEPKREEVEQKQHLVDTAEARAKAANLRGNELEKRNGLLRQANHFAAHPPKMRSEPPPVATALVIAPKINSDQPLMPPQEDLEDY